LHDSRHLRWSLQEFGYGQTVINAVWPSWWSDEAEDSRSAQAELRFSVARKLGLDPRPLVDRDEPVFVWTGNAKFKRLAAESSRELGAITAYGISLARILTRATSGSRSIEGIDALGVRGEILLRQEFVGLAELLSFCWAVGIPVIHLRLFPFNTKRMAAMTARVGDRTAIFLAREADYPAPIAYYLAHELGHIAAGHTARVAALIDLDDPLVAADSTDAEEREADRFGLQLLTGNPEFSVSTTQRSYTAQALAESALATGPQIRVEPGTLALCFGYTTSDWARATAALKVIYPAPHPVWQEVNRVASSQLDWSAVPDDSGAFLSTVMGQRV
jgi:Zn-dependent peptidase ImmA (M78 family)